MRLDGFIKKKKKKRKFNARWVGSGVDPEGVGGEYDENRLY